MNAAKDTEKDEKAAVELSKTVRLAVEAFDGHQSSDEELENLCNAALRGSSEFGQHEGDTLSERIPAKFLVTATGGQSSVIVGVASAEEALAEMRQLREEGLATVVFNGAGLECSIEELRANVAPARSHR